MNVLSLFDGMSGAQIALERAGFKVDKYFASEIDKWSIQVTQENYPKTIQIGEIENIVPSRHSIFARKGTDMLKDIEKGIDLLIGGSPCQGFSFAGKQLNFLDPRSQLFFDFVRILRWVKPRYFLFENVKMKKQYQDVISENLGVEPIEINSALVSAQNRKRLYWTNIPNVTPPEDRGILLKDVLFSDSLPIVIHMPRASERGKKTRVYEHKSPTISGASGGGHIPSLLLSKKALAYMNKKTKGGRTHWDFGYHSDIRNAKSATVVANFFKGVPYNVLRDTDCIRKFLPMEIEALQTVPMSYTAGVSYTQRCKMLGNGFTIDVIAHILSFMKF